MSSMLMLVRRRFAALSSRLVSKRFLSSSGKAGGLRVVVNGVGNDPLEALEKHVDIVPMDFPNTSNLEDDAVVIKVHCAAVHWVDLLMMAGQYQHAPPPPYSPGMEYSGVVAWAGPKAESVKIGEKVYVDIFSAGPRSYGDYQKYGGFATYAAAPAAAVHRVPPKLTMAEAASFCGAYETAHHGLVHSGCVKSGETVLVHGATGATGLAAVQICSALGANVIATGGSEEKLDVVRTVGARGKGQIIATHNYRDDESSLRQVVKDATDGRGVDVVYDTVGGAALSEESLRSMRFGGRYLVIGWTSTPFAGGGRAAGADQATANTIPTNLIMMKGMVYFFAFPFKNISLTTS